MGVFILLIGGLITAFWAYEKHNELLSEERRFWRGYHYEYECAVKAALSKAGVTLNVRPLVGADFLGPMDRGDFDLSDLERHVGWRVRGTVAGQVFESEYLLSEPSGPYPG